MIETVVSFGIIALISYFLSILIHACFISPLAKLPGDLINRCSLIPLLYHGIYGTRSKRLHEMHLKYGPVLTPAPGHVSVIDPDVAKYLFSTLDLPKSNIYDLARVSNPLYDLFSMQDKNLHDQLRKVLSKAFTASAIRDLEPVVRDTIQKMINVLGKECKESPNKVALVDMKQKFHFMSVDVIGQVAYGGVFNLLTEGEHRLPLCLASALNFVSMELVFPFLRRLTFLPFVQQQLDNQAYMKRFCAKVVETRRKELLEDASEKPHDILQVLMDAHEDGSLTKDEIYAELIVFLLAGSDTTSLTLMWWLLCLMQNEHEYERLRTEVDGVFKVNPDLVYSDLVSDCPFLLATMDEAMRLYPVGDSGTERIVTDRCIDLGNGVVVPPGTRIIGATFALLHSPLYFDQPNRFIPDRFLDSGSSSVLNRNAFKPFSQGSRDCIGQRLARMEMTLVAAHLVHRFHFTLVPNQDLDPVTEMVLTTRSGHLYCHVTEREL